MNLYAVLGVPIDADQETIRSAYRVLARRYHPDRGAGSSTEKFQQIAQAYETLIDPGRRQGYNLSLTRSGRPAIVRAGYPKTPESLRQEDPQVFGRFAPPRLYTSQHSSSDWLDLVDEWIRGW
jgi:curved DNA-binding protein CbpA